MLSLVVLISGGGSNLRALLEASEDAEFPARVVAVGADRPADGFEHAEHFGVPTFSVALSAFDDRDAWGDALLEQVRVWQPDLVVLSGFMKLLPPRVVAALAPNLINTHPAYLPEFPGAHAVRDAIAAGVTETGASVTVVQKNFEDLRADFIAQVPTGEGPDITVGAHDWLGAPIIAQERIPVLPGDTETELHERIKPVERRLLVQAILDIANGQIDLKEL